MPYQVLHIASHAIADEAEGRFGGVVLSAGRGSSKSDVFLTAEEASRLKLAADLVVLSGCSTARGQATNAEGIVGLGRSFLVAGARRVCTTLWDVPDEVPARFMPAFYGHFLANDSKPAAALRETKWVLIRAGAPPSAWTPIVLIGAPGETRRRR